MRRALLSILVGFALVVSCATARGLDVAPDKFDEKLKSYDPATLAAARDYMKTFGMKEMLEKSIPPMRQGLLAQLKAKNPGLDEKQASMFMDAFFKSAFVDDAAVTERATIILMLDIFTKDELVALNKFYSSPVGRSILAKMPVMMGRLPEVQEIMSTYVLPRALEHAVGVMKKAGVDMKL